MFNSKKNSRLLTAILGLYNGKLMFKGSIKQFKKLLNYWVLQIVFCVCKQSLRLDFQDLFIYATWSDYPENLAAINN